MEAKNWVELAGTLLVAATVLVMVWQTVLQNRLLNAQIIKDRMDMYRASHEPVTEGQVADFKRFPEDYITIKGDLTRYQDDESIRRYIHMSVLYEYLAFTHKLQELKVPDPLGKSWLEKWTKALCEIEAFRDVHKNYQGYYPAFETFVDARLPKLPTEPARDA